MENAKLKKLKVFDYIGRKFVGHTYATQEVYQVDMLNRALKALCEQRRGDKLQSFLAWCLEDAKKVPEGFYGEIAFDDAVLKAFHQCAEKGNLIVALSLLRLARIEALHVKKISSLWGRDMEERAQKEVADYRSPDTVMSLHVNGVSAKGTEWGIFKMSKTALLKEVAPYDWYFSEYLNVHYAVQDDLLFAGQMLLAMGYSLKALEKLYTDKMMRDGYTTTSMAILDQMENLRYEYLFRQTQVTFIELSGFTNSQYGMDRREAQDYSHRDIFPMKKKAG